MRAHACVRTRARVRAHACVCVCGWGGGQGAGHGPWCADFGPRRAGGVSRRGSSRAVARAPCHDLTLPRGAATCRAPGPQLCPAWACARLLCGGRSHSRAAPIPSPPPNPTIPLQHLDPSRQGPKKTVINEVPPKSSDSWTMIAIVDERLSRRWCFSCTINFSFFHRGSCSGVSLPGTLWCGAAYTLLACSPRSWCVGVVEQHRFDCV